jgi:hypothetical protein
MVQAVTSSLDVSLALRLGFAQAHDHALYSARPFDVERVRAAGPNVDSIAILEAQELEGLGRQPNGEIVAPLLDFQRHLLDGTRVHLGGAACAVNVALQGA